MSDVTRISLGRSLKGTERNFTQESQGGVIHLQRHTVYVYICGKEKCESKNMRNSVKYIEGREAYETIISL